MKDLTRLLIIIFLITLIVSIQEVTEAYQGYLEPEIAEIDWSPDGTMIVIGGGISDCGADPVKPQISFLHIIDGTTLDMLGSLEGASCQITSVNWSPDGTMIAATDVKSMLVWDAETWELLPELTRSGRGTEIVRWSPNSKHLAFSDDRTLITVVSPHHVPNNLNGLLPIYGMEIAWSPDGTQIASSLSARDDFVHIADLASRQEIVTIQPTGIAFHLHWNPNNTSLAGLVSDGSIQIWDTETGEVLLKIDRVDAVDLAWSPNGEQLATVSHDGTVRVWDGYTGQELITVQTEHLLTAISWSPDGTRLAAGGRLDVPVDIITLPTP